MWARMSRGKARLHRQLVSPTQLYEHDDSYTRLHRSPTGRIITGHLIS